MNLFHSSFLTQSGSLPLVLKSKKQLNTLQEVENFLSTSSTEIHQQLKIHGAVLLRGFPIQDGDGFASVVRALQLGPFMDYVGGDSPRKQITQGVFTSTEAPPWLTIPLHNELSYAYKQPSHIFFNCHIAPKAKGETPIADARRIFHSLDPKIREEFVKKGVTYRSAYHPGKGLIPTIVGGAHRSWQEVFLTEDKQQVEEICRKRNIACRFTKKGWLVIEETRKATALHPETKEEVWFNQAHLFKLTSRLLGFWRHLGTKILYLNKDNLLHDATFGDGSPIPLSTLHHVMDTLDTHTIAFPWQQGDVLILDNYLAMHGRASFKGPRRIFTSMTNRYEN